VGCGGATHPGWSERKPIAVNRHFKLDGPSWRIDDFDRPGQLTPGATLWWKKQISERGALFGRKHLIDEPHEHPDPIRLDQLGWACPAIPSRRPISVDPHARGNELVAVPTAATPQRGQSFG
jgi:hypothetical protein